MLKLMLQLCCTKKVQEQFNLLANVLAEPREADAILGNWYANIFAAERRKLLLFMSERTLLSFFVPDVRKGSYGSLIQKFDDGLRQLLILEDFSPRQIRDCLPQDGIITVTRTTSRKAMGNLNDLAQVYEQSILYHGKLEDSDRWNLIKNFNRMPQRNLGWGYAIDAARELLKDH